LSISAGWCSITTPLLLDAELLNSIFQILLGSVKQAFHSYCPDAPDGAWLEAVPFVHCLVQL